MADELYSRLWRCVGQCWRRRKNPRLRRQRRPSATESTAANATTLIKIDATDRGRTFYGVGAISGGGGNSRLLIDYPAKQRDEILDYLFKPGYGASLQILKLEVGGDANSTDGSEPSVEHTRGVVNCNAGYEFWLAEQAKRRNPNIKLYELAWAAPGWIGGGHFWSQDMIDYLMTWMDCARSHGLTIDYIGGWNERGFNTTWYENLHAAACGQAIEDGGRRRRLGLESGRRHGQGCRILQVDRHHRRALLMRRRRWREREHLPVHPDRPSGRPSRSGTAKVDRRTITPAPGR